MDLVVGVDAGGTTSRAVVASAAGDVLGRGRAGPGNPISAGAVAAARAMGAAVRAALGSTPPARVAGAVLGIAGTSVFTDPAVAGAFAATWAGLGLTCPMTVVGDVVTAFAGGSPLPGGHVLVAGTGAIAARVQDAEVVATVDGHGWLLGDEGSGRWIGLQALRAAVRDWSAPLAAQVAARTGVDSADELIRWAGRLPLAEIDALAPLVCAGSRAGDPTAEAITTAAAHRLVDSLDALGGGPGPVPVVLAGGLMAGDTPVRDRVRAVLRRRGVEPCVSTDPAAAAAWLAARGISPLTPADLHRRLVTGRR